MTCFKPSRHRCRPLHRQLPSRGHPGGQRSERGIQADRLLGQPRSQP